ncbi:hypothetical protein [Micromonospora chokoriensis]|uniref:hypothetical protein n=1 Tax=Micromonospora chokoriensis TaxID=356851 RepID=UPI00068C3802|nr:hypothetical protein [Micromonospora chokoriensis]
MADKRDILIRLLGEETVAKMADRAGGGLDRFGDKLDATEKDAADLDRQIADVEDSLKTLAVAFARTGDAADRIDITKAIRKQQTELRKLTKSRDLLPDFGKAGEDAAEGFGAQFIARIGPILAKAPMGATGGVIGAGIAAVVVPMLGATIAGAVLGGVGVGGVVGGVSLAAKDSRVQAASKVLGRTIVGDLEDSAARFVDPTIQGIAIIRDEWSEAASDVDDMFAATSRYVVPLARGIGGLVREIGPGLRQAAEAAGPVVRELSEGLPRIGDAISDALSDISGSADEGASAVRGLLMGLESGIRTTGTFVAGLSDVYRALVKTGQGGAHFAEGMAGWLPIVGDKITDNRERMDELAAALEGGGEEGQEAGDSIFGGLMKAAEGAKTADVEVKAFTDTLAELRDQTLAMYNTEIAFERSLDETAEAAKNAKRGIDTNTESGRKNMETLLGLVRETKAHASAVAERMGSEEAGAAVTEQGRAAFLRAADAMKVEKGEAKRLADQLFGIPNVKREVDVKTKQHPIDLTTLAGRIAAIKSKSVVISVHNKITTTRTEGRNVGIGDGIGGRASGGPIKAGTPYMVGEEGPELITPSADGFVHDAKKTARLLSDSRSAGVALGGGVAGGQTVINNYFTVNVPSTVNRAEVGREVVEAVKAYERSSGKGWRT